MLPSMPDDVSDLQPRWRSLLPTAVTAALLTLLLAQRHAGFVLGMLLLFLIPGGCYSAFIIVARPAKRNLQATKVAIWAVACVVVVAVHGVMHVSARRYADTVVQSLQAYARLHGHYPPTLEAAGVSPNEFHQRLGLSNYTLAGEVPRLAYGTTYMPFAVEQYDFDRHEWQVVD